MRLRVCIIDVGRGSRGPEIIVSRAHRDMLRRLLEMEVPEVFSGAVEIKSIAREAGYRSKVAVTAKQPRLDPVGACVGQRGYRIQNIVGELNDEKIDVVAWSPDTATFIANALSPAKPVDVVLDEAAEGGRTATVVVPDKQLSLAIGKEGQNVRLAAKLTGWRIDIKSIVEMEEEARARKERAAAPAREDILTRAESILLGAEDVVEEVFELPVAEEEVSEEPEAEPIPVEVEAAEPAPEPIVEEPAVEVEEAPPEEEAEPVAEEAGEEALEPALELEVGDDILDWKAEEKTEEPRLTKKQRKKGKAAAKRDEMGHDISRRPSRRSSRRRDWEDWDE
jgi:N utilization substance protein A